MTEALRRGITAEEINAVTKVDIWFLDRLNEIVNMESMLSVCGAPDRELLLKAKQMGFTDGLIAELCGEDKAKIRDLREEYGIHAVFKMVDTCAAEFEARTPYYYSTFDEENEATSQDDGQRKDLVLGSGPIRIGQ